MATTFPITNNYKISYNSNICKEGCTCRFFFRDNEISSIVRVASCEISLSKHYLNSVSPLSYHP